VARDDDASADATTVIPRYGEGGCFVDHCDAATVSRIQEALLASTPKKNGVAGPGCLSSLTFAVKDNLDVRGARTGAGSPRWLATHPSAANANARAVDAFVNAGAVFVGKTQMDELAWALQGENAHYGTPVNPAAPERIPGGSSSGSAAAVAAGFCDLALGTDTAGSVRVPASYCGVFGFRPTHGAVSMRGCVPLAPSFDTLGWFARDAKTLQRGGDALLPDDACNESFSRAVLAEDALEACDEVTADIVRLCVERLAAKNARVFRDAQRVRLGGDGGEGSLALPPAPALSEWWDAFRALQTREVWSALGSWIEAHDDTLEGFGPGVRDRFAAARDACRNAQDDPEAELRIVNALWRFANRFGASPQTREGRRGGDSALRARPAHSAHVRGGGGGGVPRIAAQADLRRGLRGRAAGDHSRRRARGKSRWWIIGPGGRLADERAGHGQGVAGARQGTHRVVVSVLVAAVRGMARVACLCVVKNTRVLS
jgi:amidase